MTNTLVQSCHSTLSSNQIIYQRRLNKIMGASTQLVACLTRQRMKERGIVKSYANLGLYSNEFMFGNCWYGWTVRRKSARIKRRSKCLYQTTMLTWLIFNSATLEGLKVLKRITALMCIGLEKKIVFWFFRTKEKHRVGIYSERSSHFFHTLHPHVINLFASCIINKCIWSKIPLYLMFICRLINFKCPRSLAFKCLNSSEAKSLLSEQKKNPQLVAHRENNIS